MGSDVKETIFGTRNVELIHIVNHLFLPKKLPQSEEDDIVQIELALLQYLITNAGTLLNRNSLLNTSHTLNTWMTLQDRKVYLDKTLGKAKVGESSCLFVTKQNCTILFTKLNQTLMRVITFRASFPNEHITGTQGSLKVTYPETVDVVPISPLLLSTCFSKQIWNLTSSTCSIAMPTSRKAGKNHPETRETSNPYVISDFLLSMLCPLESGSYDKRAEKRKIEFQKKVRDQVNWDNSLLPFRRSGLWMSLKVILQLSLNEEMKSREDAIVMYKMILLETLTSMAVEYAGSNGARWDISAQIMAKLARRGKKLSKLNIWHNADLNLQRQETLKRAFDAIEKIHGQVSKEWNTTAACPKNVLVGMQQIFHKDWKNDCIHPMNELTEYLNKERIPNTGHISFDNLQNIDPVIQTATLDSLLERIQGLSSEQQDVHLNNESIWLYQVEWYARHGLVRGQPYEKIFKLLTSYYSKAFELYGKTYADPVYYSRLGITALKFVSILDEIAVGAYPLLRKYKTGIEPEMFDRLVIPEKCEMELVEDLKNYFIGRNSGAEFGFWLGNSNITKESFSVKFAEGNLEMQNLKQNILDQMERNIEKKKAEIQTAKRECQEIQKRLSQLSHSYKWHSYYEKNIHDNCCYRCCVESELDIKKKSVSQIEHPLPFENYLRDAVIFELRIPKEIAYLRDSSIILLEGIFDHDTLFAPKLEEENIHTKWTEFKELQIWPKTGHQGLYRLGSTRKSTLTSHYGTNLDVLNHTEDDFILPNGLDCRYFRTLEMGERGPMPGPFTYQILNEDIDDKDGYKSLQFALDVGRPTENEVISKQYLCHQKITLKEFKMFGSMRSAHLVQLRNLYVGIVSKVLSLEKEPVLQLIMQTLWELGPGKREIHVDFENDENKSFTFAFVELLMKTGEENATNWGKPIVFLSLTVVAIRILEMTKSNDVKERVSKLLPRYREILDGWHSKLENLLEKEIDKKETQMLMNLLLKSSICSVYTFNVSSNDNMSHVFKEPSDITFFVKALCRLHHLTVRENILTVCPPSRFVQNLLRQARSFIPLSLQDFLHKKLVSFHENFALHDFVCSRGISAKEIPRDEVPVFRHESFVRNKKHAYQATYKNKVVCVDILRGAFFVDGYPPSVLPESIIRHPLYKSFFKSNQFRVQRDSCTFSTTDKYRGNHYKFTEVQNQLIIRQLSNENDSWFELLPKRLLEDKIPHDLMQNYTHWFGSDTNGVYFRQPSDSETNENWENEIDYVFSPVPNEGSSIPNDWELRKYDNANKSNCYLLYIDSNGFQNITRNFRNLESHTFIHVVIEKGNGNENKFRISANLWRFNLTFFMSHDDGLLHCENYPGYYIPVSKNNEQNLDTLVGLNSGIVLEKCTKSEPSGKKRMFLIQHGTVAINANGCNGKHQSVVVSGEEVKNPPYFKFEVDQLLKRLRPENSKSAWLYLALLHGATSSPFPDPFTQLTGTEMAIWILQSGFPWSCYPYDQECLDILYQISDLSPKYTYYPAHLKNMQSVQWPEGLSQNSYAAYDGFILIAQKLLADSMRVSGLFTEEPPKIKDVDSELDLNIRSYRRNINFYNKSCHLSGQFDAALHTSSNLVVYSQLRLGSDQDMAKLAKYRQSKILAPISQPTTTLIMTDDPLPHLGKHEIVRDDLPTWFKTKLRKCWLQVYALALKSSTQEMEHELTLILGAKLYSQKGSLGQLLNLHNISLSHGNGEVRSIFPEPPVSITQTSYIPTKYEFESCVINEIFKSVADGPPGKDDFETYTKFNEAINAYNSSLREQLTRTVQKLKSLYWPIESIDSPCLKIVLSGNELLNFTETELQRLNQNLRNWFNNLKLKMFVTSVDDLLRKLQDKGMTQELSVEPPVPWTIQVRTIPDIGVTWLDTENDVSCEIAQDAMKIFRTGKIDKLGCDLESTFLRERNACFELLEKFGNKLHQIVLGNSPMNMSLDRAGLNARLAPIVLLRDHLSKITTTSLSERNCYIGSLAVVWAHIKRLNRLITFESNQEKYSVELKREMESQECENWSPLDNLEWLLLELELDITIRPVQVQVARRMICMPNGNNGVMQLNMGEGKTSVIIPMIVVTLSKDDLLCRVTVLNSIYATNYNLLASTIGGFLNKRLYSVPCSRDLKIEKYLDQIQNMWEECLHIKGAVITLPEYRLSFRLQMYNNLLQNGKMDTAMKIYRTESWLRKHARDLVDESDEIFSVKYQLIYTTGQQQKIDGNKMRWLVCQKLLDFLPEVGAELHTKFGSKAIEFQPKMVLKDPEIFPDFRILSDECKDKFYELVAAGILNGKVNLIGGILSEDERQIVKEFLIDENISTDDHNKIVQVEGISLEDRMALYLVSGYLRRGILFASLKKRWRVEYGVKMSKTGSSPKLMAVPFRAKDVAAERTEFGHPDMAIVLTQLSYYYSGLSDQQLFQCFKILETRVTGPAGVYNSWIMEIPASKIKSESVKTYNGINLQDYEQRTCHLFPLLRKHKAVIDFWLENAVFPKECKQFPGKLVTNAWDLCYDKCEHPTTGFSGTNDTSLLLPAQITQQDLELLQTTNDKMEDTLKLGENQLKRSLAMGVRCKKVLKFMTYDGLRVLVDAGALMLELGNEGIAELWLEVDQSLEAVVYFNEDGEMVTKIRRHTEYQKRSKGEKDSLLTLSPLKDRLENCAVYLDDQHTRGTDIKLPTNFKACVTVGRGMRRDKLIQACMRMRKLGSGQSVHFYLSHEVQNKILDQMNQSGSPTVHDIINWTKQNSREFEKDGLVYWAMNARNYAKNIAADELFELSMKSEQDGKILAERCQDPDAQSLVSMYGVYHNQILVTELIPQWFSRIKNKLTKTASSFPDFGACLPISVIQTLNAIEQAVLSKCKANIPDKVFFQSMLDEEQEKELEPEPEVEEQNYRPPIRQPLEPTLHNNVLYCVKKLKNATRMESITSIGEIFRETRIHDKIQGASWGTQCFATEDFIKALEETSITKNGEDVDCFLRSIRFFVSFNNGEGTTVLLLSLHEVNGLLSYIRGRQCLPGTTLHMFSGRWMDGQPIFANDSRLQLPVREDSRRIRLDDNVLAPLLIAGGNLYFSGINEEKAFARFLGLRLRPWTEGEEKAFQEKGITSTGFVLPLCPTLREGCDFTQDPTEMLMAILNMRNDVLRDADHTVSILKTCHSAFSSDN